VGLELFSPPVGGPPPRGNLYTSVAQVMLVTTSDGQLYSGPPTACGLARFYASTALAPSPAVHGIARVSNRFCGFDGDTRFSTCVSFVAVGAQGAEGTATAYSSYQPGYGMWLDMPSLPLAAPVLRAVVGVSSGVLRLSRSKLEAHVLDCEGRGDVLPASPTVVFSGRLTPRSANDPLAGVWLFLCGSTPTCVACLVLGVGVGCIAVTWSQGTRLIQFQ
jgi:hypothetical protein